MAIRRRQDTSGKHLTIGDVAAYHARYREQARSYGRAQAEKHARSGGAASKVRRVPITAEVERKALKALDGKTVSKWQHR